MLEICLRSCCYISIFDICIVHLLSSRCVEMVLHGTWRWSFFMVCRDGCILRTHGVLGKGVVYAFIWHVILGVKMVSLLCHGILLIHF